MSPKRCAGFSQTQNFVCCWFMKHVKVTVDTMSSKSYPLCPVNIILSFTVSSPLYSSCDIKATLILYALHSPSHPAAYLQSQIYLLPITPPFNLTITTNKLIFCNTEHITNAQGILANSQLRTSAKLEGIPFHCHT
jgi:hypothetical protein